MRTAPRPASRRPATSMAQGRDLHGLARRMAGVRAVGDLTGHRQVRTRWSARVHGRAARLHRQQQQRRTQRDQRRTANWSQMRDAFGGGDHRVMRSEARRQEGANSCPPWPTGCGRRRRVSQYFHPARGPQPGQGGDQDLHALGCSQRARPWISGGAVMGRPRRLVILPERPPPPCGTAAVPPPGTRRREGSSSATPSPTTR